VRVNHQRTLIFGAATLAAVGFGYAAWRYRLRELSTTIEAGDFERADALVAELLAAGELGRELRVLTGLLAFCLVAMLVTTKPESQTAVAKPLKFGFHPSPAQ
jgi:hypothetical protein